MTNLKALIDEFSAKIEVSIEKGVSTADILSPESPSTRRAVGVVPVPTFVVQKNLDNYVVPAFATHWGVICTSNLYPDVQMLFHLLYNPSTRSMSFSASSWKETDSKHSITSVGTTPYDYDEVVRIGSLLFEKFDLLNRNSVNKAV